MLTSKGFAFSPKSSVSPFGRGDRVKIKVTISDSLEPGLHTSDDWPLRGREGVLLGYSVPRGYAIVDFGSGEERLIHPENLAGV